jgi:hypothetical protein
MIHLPPTSSSLLLLPDPLPLHLSLLPVPISPLALGDYEFMSMSIPPPLLAVLLTGVSSSLGGPCLLRHRAPIAQVQP